MSEQPEGVPLGMRIARLLTGYTLGEALANCRVVELEPDNVYNRPLEDVPDPPGHKRKQPLEFREPETGECYIASDGAFRKRGEEKGRHFNSPDWRRIILQEPPKPQERVFLFREGGPGGAYLSRSASGIGGTATEIPAQGTPEYEALIERLVRQIFTPRTRQFDPNGSYAAGLHAVLAELFKAEGK